MAIERLCVKQSSPSEETIDGKDFYSTNRTNFKKAFQKKEISIHFQEKKKKITSPWRIHLNPALTLYGFCWQVNKDNKIPQ